MDLSFKTTSFVYKTYYSRDGNRFQGDSYTFNVSNFTFYNQNPIAPIDNAYFKNIKKN
ncbi:hypothetical protein LSA01_07340 [Latilactobacillus sakei]|nr:hypothetical protein LSA01_07340 [Latilactobacillus sakei]GEL36591.1 hypothetical protein LSA02_13260 [Latilactobacillus sakei subsp. sakei]